jgi:hypothetical protein
MKCFFLIIFLYFFQNQAFGQNQYEYMGILRLNNKNSELISYRLVFTERFGKIEGYSITDLSGAHETKNLIMGEYNFATKNLQFKETDLVYTKSQINTTDFCRVNFKGKVNLEQGKSKIDGKFKGLFENDQPCISGSLILIGSEEVYHKMGKLDLKIQKSNKVTDAEKEQLNSISIIDSLRTNHLSKDENVSLFWQREKAIFEIWDNGKIDGDQINVFVNGKLVLRNFIVNSKKELLEVKLLPGKNEIKIVAVNEGEIPPNTVMIQLVGDHKNNIQFQSNLKKGEHAIFTLIKKY